MPRKKAQPDVHAVAHAKVMEKFRNATPEEHIESLKRAGILTKTGRFAAPYREFGAMVMGKRAKTAAR
jgi:hypothetical protein